MELLRHIPVEKTVRDDIMGVMDEACIFCKIAAKEAQAETVYEDDEIVAFNDLNPKAPVHILFIPKKHIGSLNLVEDGDIPVLGKMLVAIKKTAEDHGIAGSGYRTVINCNRDAGQAVLHLHAHLLGGRPMSWPPG